MAEAIGYLILTAAELVEFGSVGAASAAAAGLGGSAFLGLSGLTVAGAVGEAAVLGTSEANEPSGKVGVGTLRHAAGLTLPPVGGLA